MAKKMTGSEIAIGGYENEEAVANKFNNWRNDKDAKKWLKIMMYDLEEIVSVKAEKIGGRGYKSDINIIIVIQIVKRDKKTNLTSIENIQVKLVSNSKRGFNQVEKKKIDKYIEMWHISPELAKLLRHYDGELPPYKDNTKNEKRMFLNEFTEEEQKQVLDFFQKNLVMIISDVIRGRGRFAAEWTLIINKDREKKMHRWILISINEAIQHYCGDYKAEITKSGNMRLGNITVQRKGGDKGADSANMLQFKSDPLSLFSEETKNNSIDWEMD